MSLFKCVPCVFADMRLSAYPKFVLYKICSSYKLQTLRLYKFIYLGRKILQKKPKENKKQKNPTNNV